jgi:hypothetical protein
VTLAGRGPAVIGLVLVLAACAEKAPEPAPLQSWLVVPEAEVRIGVAEGEPALELHRAGDAVRLDDGRIVVANAGTSELRIFDSTGRYLRAVGRRGSGPGEYQGALGLTPAGRDSLIVYDAGSGRFSVLDQEGEYAGTLAIGNQKFPWDDWLTEDAWVSGVRDFRLRPCVAAVLAQSDVDGQNAVRRAILDDLGALWVRTLPESAEGAWRIYDLEGTPLGTASLPAGLEPYQIGRDFVLGRTLDGDGIERIELHRFSAGARRGSRSCALPSSDDRMAPIPELGADIANAVVAQEAWFADHMAYSANADSLDWNSETGTGLTIVAASSAGWMGIVAPVGPDHPICAIAVGDVTPAGWLEGAPMCAAAPPRGKARN